MSTIVPKTADTKASSQSDIELWLIKRFAALTDSSEDTIDVDIPFADYSLDSSVAVSVATELSIWLDRDLSVTMFWEYPTIRTLAEGVGRLLEAPSRVS